MGVALRLTELACKTRIVPVWKGHPRDVSQEDIMISLHHSLMRLSRPGRESNSSIDVSVTRREACRSWSLP